MIDYTKGKIMLFILVLLLKIYLQDLNVISMILVVVYISMLKVIIMEIGANAL
jgi:hypothetical protein